MQKDETFFEEVNTEEKAYFLGLMYADGTNSSDTTFKNSSKGKQFSIELQEEDKHILEHFKKCLSSDLILRFGGEESKK